MQIQISWLLQKPTDLDLHCLLRQGMSCSGREGLRVILYHLLEIGKEMTERINPSPAEPGYVLPLQTVQITDLDLHCLALRM